MLHPLPVCFLDPAFLSSLGNYFFSFHVLCGGPTLAITTCLHPKENHSQTWLTMKPHSLLHNDLQGACVMQARPTQYMGIRRKTLLFLSDHIL